MEAILPELEISLGVCVSALALVVLALGGILMGHLSDLEKAGKRFFWMEESSVPGPELRIFLPGDIEILHAA